MSTLYYRERLHYVYRALRNPIIAVGFIYYSAIRMYRRALKYLQFFYNFDIRTILRRHISSDEPVGHHLFSVHGMVWELNTPRDWTKSVSDPETQLYIDRWNWLIQSSAQPSFTQGIGLMRSWIDMFAQTAREAGDPYSTGERIANATIFIHSKSPGFTLEIPYDIRCALSRMADTILSHIEWDKGTSNHLIQNARALMCAGIALDRSDHIESGIRLLFSVSSILITEDGFLREHSSHYHFLVTRWFCDIHSLCRRFVAPIAQRTLDLTLSKLLSRCQFFLVYNTTTSSFTFPLIGDTSPDCSPEWVKSYICSHPAMARESRKIVNRCFEPYSESGWYRLDFNQNTFFWHVPSFKQRYPNHGHSDLCSFIFYRHGIPIIVDPGRPRYTENIGCGADYHNSLVIDSLGPVPDNRDYFFPDSAVQCSVKTDWDWSSVDEFVFTLHNPGFERILDDPISHTRTFIITPNELRIVDKLIGLRSHRASFFIHGAPGATMTECEANDTRSVLSVCNERINISASVSPAGCAAKNIPIHIEKFHFAPEYGVTVSSHRTRTDLFVHLPAVITHSIQFATTDL